MSAPVNQSANMSYVSPEQREQSRDEDALKNADTRVVTTGLGFAAVVGIGLIDWRTGWEFTAFVLYGFPILFATLRAGSGSGATLAIVSGLMWAFANLGSHPYNSEGAFIWA